MDGLAIIIHSIKYQIHDFSFILMQFKTRKLTRNYRNILRKWWSTHYSIVMNILKVLVKINDDLNQSSTPPEVTYLQNFVNNEKQIKKTIDDKINAIDYYVKKKPLKIGELYEMWKEYNLLMFDYLIKLEIKLQSCTKKYYTENSFFNLYINRLDSVSLGNVIHYNGGKKSFLKYMKKSKIPIYYWYCRYNFDNFFFKRNTINRINQMKYI